MRILCLAEDSLETSSLIFSYLKNNEKYLWMSSAAVVIGAFRVNLLGFYSVIWTVDISKWNKKCVLDCCCGKYSVLFY